MGCWGTFEFEYKIRNPRNNIGKLVMIPASMAPFRGMNNLRP